MPLLAVLAFSAAAAVQPSSYETVWREARLVEERGDRAGAMAKLDEALRRAGASDEPGVWKLRIQKAMWLADVGKTDESALILAQPLPPKLKGSEVAARHLFAEAMLAFYSGKGDPMALLEKARIAARNMPAVLAEILRVTGTEAAGREAIRLAKQSGDQFLVMKAESGLVQTLGSLGRFGEAAELGDQLLPRLERARMQKTLARHYGNLGWIYSALGNYDRAAELLSKSIAEAERVQYVDILTWYSTLASVHVDRRDWAAAERDALRVISLTEKKPRPARGDAYASLARAYLETGRLAEARKALATATNNSYSRVIAARIDIAAGAHDAAQKKLLAILESGADLEAQGQLARVYAISRQTSLARQAFATAASLVNKARPDKSASADARLSFFNTAKELFDNYVDFLVATNRAEEALLITETSRAQMLEEARDVEANRKLDLRAIARARNATILCYWLGHENSYVWTITGGGVQLQHLRKRAEIEAAVARYSQLITSSGGTLDRIGGRGHSLYQMLVGAANIPAGSRVVIIPDGALHTLNFETLVTPQKRYWINDVTLANASSLQILARGARPAPASPTLLLVGNPPQADPAFPPLPKAADEIARIQKRFGARAKALTGSAATPAAYVAASPAGFDFVHFTAHGTANRVRPLDGAVILGREKDGDYRLVAREIAKQPLAARLVTISSCHGAGATTYAGEGLVGLAWAFLYAGADQVVAALWAVSDTAAPKLMDDLYAGINARRDPAVALRDAKLALIRATNSPHQHPRYWAPFVIYQ